MIVQAFRTGDGTGALTTPWSGGSGGRGRAFHPRWHLRKTTMKRSVGIGLIAGGLVSLGAVYGLRAPEAKAQRARTEPHWEYKVGVFSYNPGERLTDDQRRVFYERTLNEQAREGWEVI